MSNIDPQYKSEEIISHLFPAAVSGLILPIDDYLPQLKPDEYKIVHKASNKRKFEFSTGRWCAKQLLTRHSLNDFSLLSGENREPIWPDGFVGSISHCKDQCGAVVADIDTIKSIGFDVETQKKLKNNIAKIVCTDLEKNWLSQLEPDLYDSLVLLIFSLKESVYKCVFQNQKIKLSFKDCSIIPEIEHNTAQIKFNKPSMDLNIELRFKLTEAYIYSGAIHRNK